MGIPVIEQTKIQAQVLAPLVKALRRNWARNTRTHSFARHSAMCIIASANSGGARESMHVGGNMALAFASFAKGGVVDYSVRAQSQDTYEIDVTECRYAQFFKELGEPARGFLLVCSLDLPFADGFGDIKRTGTQTIM